MKIMIDFITYVKDILEEQGKTTQILFENNIISANTFYKYKQRTPSLKTIIKLANYLEVSIDYLFKLTEDNNFTTYSYNSDIFYNNLETMLKSKKLSGREFCKIMQYSKDNLLRWKNGTIPSVQNLLEVANFFNCSINDLLQ